MRAETRGLSRGSFGRAWILVLVPLLAACPRSVAEGPLARLGGAAQEDLCSGVLASAIEAVGASRAEEDVPSLVAAVEWASAHGDLECNPVITARQLWQTALRSLGAVEGEAAGLGLVASLRESHRPGSVHDRWNADNRLETATALRMLAGRGALEAEVVDAILDWYGAGALDCSVDDHRGRVVQLVSGAGEAGLRALARRFPPAEDAGRCAPGWLLSDVFDGAPEELGHAIVEEIAAPGDEDRAERIAAALPATTGALRAALAGIACDGALAAARSSIEASTGDPSAIVDEAVGACASRAEADEAIRDLRRRAVDWYVGHGEAEEAWIALEALPEEEVDDEFRALVGVPVIFARLEAGAVDEAVEMFETLRGFLGPESTDLAPAGEAVRAALLEAAEQSWQARSLDDVGRLGQLVERLFGRCAETERYELILLFADAGAVAPDATCPPREERRAFYDRLEAAEHRVEEAYPDDDALAALATDSLRRWLAWNRRCR